MTLLAAHDLLAYNDIRTDHEGKFSNFLVFVGRPELAKLSQLDKSAYAIQVRATHPPFLPTVISLKCEQLVTQVNYGPVLSKQYFISAALCGEAESAEFKEVSEGEITALGLGKTNSFKNFKSQAENRFYEVNLYQRHPRSNRRVKVNAERPEGIDL